MECGFNPLTFWNYTSNQGKMVYEKLAGNSLLIFEKNYLSPLSNFNHGQIF